MIIPMNTVELVLNWSLELHVVTNAVAAAIALGFASVRARIFFLIRLGDDQLTRSIGQLVLLVFIAGDDVVAVFHPLNVRLRRATDSALQ